MFDESVIDLDIQEAIDNQLGEPEWFDPKTAEIAAKLKNRDIAMPNDWKIDVATGLPMELRTGFEMGREFYGYYQSGWTSAAIAWQTQNPG